MLEIIKNVCILKGTELFLNYPNDDSLNNVLKMIYPVYYKNWNFKSIIDRSPAGTEANLNLLKKLYKKENKIIFLIRPLLEVLASWITWYLKTSDNFILNLSTPFYT